MSEEIVEAINGKRKPSRASIVQEYLQAFLDELSAGLQKMCARVAKVANENLRKVREEHEEAHALNDRTKPSYNRFTCPLPFPSLSQVAISISSHRLSILSL
ncbi:MAG: hypothetical protein RLZZ453_428 [Chlamydiota bacterium]|jgi:hypothetical protein